MKEAGGPRASVTTPMTSTGALVPTRVERRSIVCGGGGQPGVVTAECVCGLSQGRAWLWLGGVVLGSFANALRCQGANHELESDLHGHLGHVLGLLLQEKRGRLGCEPRPPSGARSAREEPRR